MTEEKINFDGWNDIDSVDKAAAFSLAEKSYKRLVAKVKNDVSLHLHLKVHKQAKHSKPYYELKTKFKSPGLFFEAKASSWKLLQAVKDSLITIERDVMENLSRKAKAR